MLTRFIASTVLLCAALVAMNDVHAAGTRGISVSVKQSDARDAPVAGQVELYQSSFALVIGNDAYNNGWPPLTNAIKDAELVAEMLENKGFEVELHKNLSSDDLNTVFKKFFILKGDDPESRLFIWYAGHGATVDGEGYLVPIDAPVPSVGGEFKFASSALRDFGTYMRQARAKHAYAVFDSCFAGTVFSAQRDLPSAAITLATTMPVRQFLTSGDADQTVSDDGTFRELFIRAVRGEERSDSNGDGYVTATEIGMFLGDRITNLTQSLQTPRFGKLRDKDFDRGDFVFKLPRGSYADTMNNFQQGNGAVTVSAPSNAAEIAFWNSLKDSSNPAEFDAYIETYPEGTFVALARVKKNQLLEKAKPAPKPAPRKKEKAPRRYELVYRNDDFEALRTANVRSDPFNDAMRVAQLEAGARVWVIGEATTSTATWYRVARDGAELGFVYSPLLGPAEQAVAVIDKPIEDVPVEGQRGYLEDEPVTGEPEQRNSDDIWSRFEDKLHQESVEEDRLPAQVRSIMGRAESGSVEAQAQLAYLYHTGDESLSINADLEKAAYWYEQAAEGGDPRAQVNLGLMLQNGEGVPAAPTMAVRWFREAAEQGNADAQQLLAYHYETGRAVPVDYARALELYTAAAMKGKATAQHNLARMYQLGIGTDVDLVKARHWYRKAAEQGFDESSKQLALMEKQG